MKNLLIGNGLSISISEKFTYNSLKEKVNGNLSPAAARLFNKLGTNDFEHLLAKVQDAREVIEALTDGQMIVSQAITEEIKTKLIEAIQSMMTPAFPAEHGLNPQHLNSALIKYNNTFTTNYDIYLYWARKSHTDFNIIDFFFSANGSFDRNNVEQKGRNAIYFLHGAIFLFEEDNRVIKISKGDFNTLKEAVESRIVDSNSYPLFISEGSSADKLASIKKNEYLSFCYDSLRSITGSLDIYGHSLNSLVDGHIVDAIKDSKINKVAFYKRNLQGMGAAQKAHLQAKLNDVLSLEVELIDASLHELSNWHVFAEV